MKRVLIASATDPPVAALLVASYLKKSNVVEVEWGSETSLRINEHNLSSTVTIIRYLARCVPSLYGSNALEKTEIDHWLSFSVGPLSCSRDFKDAIAYLDRILGPVTYLVGEQLSVADFAVWGALYSNSAWSVELSKQTLNLNRWFDFIKSSTSVQEALSLLSKNVKTPKIEESGRKEEGKFIELPGAEMGKVVVRFPPEASGYLHIGHAKAALLNQYYQLAFKGKLVMRFDDTNPAKEKVDFEKVILEDVEMLEIKPDMFTHTSNYFDLMLEMCEKLIKQQKAYVDDTEPEQMKTEREQKIESKNRNNSVEKNLQLWKEMKDGSDFGKTCCVRAKIDMSSANGCMRDPTIYRCKVEPHPRTGLKYKVYPTYDFACPIVDSIEGVTHCLRTMEYHDRDDQFYWFIDALELRKPVIWEYSRLNMTNTVLSKRKLTWFVEQGLVDGWDDPRFPTVRGILRRGMTVEGLKQFIIAQGSSRSVVVMEWDKIWAFNKKVIDPVAPRFTALEAGLTVPVLVSGVKEESLIVPRHPKNPDVGNKTVWVGPRILIDRADAEVLKEGENTTFINWGNLLIKKINRKGNKIESVEAEPKLDNKDFKKTLKITWLAETEKAKFTPTYCVYFDHIISKPVLAKDEDFKMYIPKNTRTEVIMVGDPELASLKVGDIIQLQRRGFFRVDSAYQSASIYTGKDSPIVLFSIPDGHAKELPTAGVPKKQEQAMSNKEKAQSAKGKAAEKSPAEEFPTTPIGTSDASSINLLIIQQGDKIRKLKEEKAAKDVIDPAVKVLLELKAKFKAISGKDWKPGTIQDIPAKTEDKLDAQDLSAKITEQGNQVRQLKGAKAAKANIDAAVQVLLKLKAEFKSISWKDWKPEAIQDTPDKTGDKVDANDLSAKITEQGNQVRKLKKEKAAKADIDAAVEVLLSLKNQFKLATGQEWKPDLNPVKENASSVPLAKDDSLSSRNTLLLKIADQGNKVRSLKTAKATKDIVEKEVHVLLALKAEFKATTGEDWKPDLKPTMSSPSQSISTPPSLSQTESVPITNKSAADSLMIRINEQGDAVRQLKNSKASKAEIEEAVGKLLKLKEEYKQSTGSDFPTAGRGSKAAKPPAPAKAASQPKEKSKPKEKESEEGQGSKKQTRLGMEARKEENLPDWYSQVIQKGEMIEYYDVSGCYILRPWAFAIWEVLSSWFDSEIKKLGVQNCYFPMFVSKGALEKEKSHIADFSPEVAWVTKSGDSDLSEPIAIRPTSETVMYPAFAKWIQSYRDLPIKLNQWNNVVRWEFKHPQPFLRTREFLWQEGHTAYASQEEACAEVHLILDLYAKIYTDLLAIPVVKGKKTEKEKFAGGDFTTTVEAFVSASGRAIQGATSHHLGQNFSKMFDIVFEDPETQEKRYIYQNSWGFTTRTIGVMIMIHADNQGLVLPPRVAPIQIVVVPCGISAAMQEDEKKALLSSCKELEDSLCKVSVRVHCDYRDNYSPGWKFNHWELKGVPVRVELGPKDLKSKQLVAVRRDSGQKITITRDKAIKELPDLLNAVQQAMFDKASNELSTHTTIVKDFKEFCQAVDEKKIVLAPFCGEIPCEDNIKKHSARDADQPQDAAAPSMGAKSLCIPFDQPAEIVGSDRCIHPECQAKPKFYTLFGRSY